MNILDLIDSMARDMPNKAVSKDNMFEYVLQKRPNASLIKMDKEFSAIKNAFHLATLDELTNFLMNDKQLSSKISSYNQEQLKSLYNNQYLVDIDNFSNNEVSINNSSRQIVIDISTEDILNDGVPPLFTYYDLQGRYHGILAYFAYNDNPTMSDYMGAINNHSPQYYNDMADDSINKILDVVKSLNDGNNHANKNDILSKLEPKSKDDKHTKELIIINLMLSVGKVPAKDLLQYIKDSYSSDYLYLKKVNMMLVRKLNYMARENFIIDNLLDGIIDEHMNIHLNKINDDFSSITYKELIDLLNNKISKDNNF